MPSDSEHDPEATGVTFADVALQAAVLAFVIDSAPNPVPLEELAILLFEGRFTPEEEAQTLRAAEWLVREGLLEQTGGALRPASPPAGLARASRAWG